MTHEDRGHYAKKHSADLKVDPDIAEAVKNRISGEEISCAKAFGIVKDLNTSPADVGFTLDSLEVKIAKCQLGLYGYRPAKKAVKPAENVSKELEDSLREALINERLPCKAAWELAERFNMGKMEVASACEALGIKISSCQLGAF
jgi:hypothetical protein